MGNCFGKRVHEPTPAARHRHHRAPPHISISSPIIDRLQMQNKHVLVPRELLIALSRSPEFLPFFQNAWWSRLQLDVRTEDITRDEYMVQRIAGVVESGIRRVSRAEDETGLLRVVFEILAVVETGDVDSMDRHEPCQRALDIMFPERIRHPPATATAATGRPSTRDHALRELDIAPMAIKRPPIALVHIAPNRVSEQSTTHGHVKLTTAIDMHTSFFWDVGEYGEGED